MHRRPSFVLAAAGVALASAAFALDDFEDGSTQGWISGASHPSPPANVANGGPGGAGDNYLAVTANGTAGAGGKLVFFKSTGDYSGDWTAAGFDRVDMDVANFGATPLELRIAIDGPGGTFATTDSVIVPATGTWTSVSLDVSSADFTADLGTNIAATLGGVFLTRIVHSTLPTFNGEDIVASAGFDNIGIANTSSAVQDWTLYE